MADGEERSYVIFRYDGLLLHTKPITREEAWWLYQDAYSASYLDRESRARYLSEWGNVMDLQGYAGAARPSGALYVLLIQLENIYPDRGTFEEKVSWLLGHEDLQPQDRQLLEEIAGKMMEFLARPVEPKPLGPLPVRYLEMPYPHVELGRRRRAAKRTTPKAAWLAYARVLQHLSYGISVFEGSFWLWRQAGGTEAVAVRRDAGDEEVIRAVLDDGAVQAFLDMTAEYFRQVINEHEAELIDEGYADVARKVKVILAMLELLKAGRREEGVPA